MKEKCSLAEKIMPCDFTTTHSASLLSACWCHKTLFIDYKLNNAILVVPPDSVAAINCATWPQQQQWKCALVCGYFLRGIPFFSPATTAVSFQARKPNSFSRWYQLALKSRYGRSWCQPAVQPRFAKTCNVLGQYWTWTRINLNVWNDDLYAKSIGIKE